MMHLIGVIDIDAIGRSFRESFFMIWETLWALILGFLLSGIVQSFVSKRQILRTLGNHRPAAVARASIYGMASSSCSYAASAMAKSLFQKGADFVSATIFMVAATNLVVELGLVLLALLGWQFLGAEFVGGVIMIAILAILGGAFLRGKRIDQACERLVTNARSGEGHHAHDDSPQEALSLDDEPLAAKIRSRRAWSHAASYAVSDAAMLRRELVIGFLAAGFLAVLVPTSVWTHLYFEGHGGWTAIENALVGPIIAFLSCVCSDGNIPLAAALWHGGISFAGVIAFVFADLVAAPLILVYWRFYGAALALRLVAVLYGAIVIASLLTGEIFSAFDIIPHKRPAEIAPEHLAWNTTTALNIVFAVLAIGCYLLRRQDVYDAEADLATDPVCGMKVRPNIAPASMSFGDATYFFCSDGCFERFHHSPSTYANTSITTDAQR